MKVMTFNFYPWKFAPVKLTIHHNLTARRVRAKIFVMMSSRLVDESSLKKAEAYIESAIKPDFFLQLIPSSSHQRLVVAPARKRDFYAKVSLKKKTIRNT